MRLHPVISTIALLFSMSMTSAALAAGAEVTVTETITYEDVLEEAEQPAFTPEISRNGPVSAIGTFGPFQVIGFDTVELRGVIDSDGPRHFQRLLQRFPQIRLLKMIECPGSEDDDANLELARLVHRAGISTFVPADGSIRSGGVELFLAGKTRKIESGAQFGVHSWVDEDGREASAYPANDPVHREYLRYYEEMGFKPEQALAFYTFTNSAAHSDGVHYMTPAEIARFGLTN